MTEEEIFSIKFKKETIGQSINFFYLSYLRAFTHGYVFSLSQRCRFFGIKLVPFCGGCRDYGR